MNEYSNESQALTFNHEHVYWVESIIGQRVLLFDWAVMITLKTCNCNKVGTHAFLLIHTLSKLNKKKEARKVYTFNSRVYRQLFLMLNGI